MIRVLIVFADGQTKIAPYPDWAPLKPRIFAGHPAGGSRPVSFRGWMGDPDNRETRTARFEEVVSDNGATPLVEHAVPPRPDAPAEVHRPGTPSEKQGTSTGPAPATTGAPPSPAERAARQAEQRRLDNARVTRDYRLLPPSDD